MTRKILQGLLYSVVGSLTYLIFLYLTFPSDVARERLIYEANKAGVKLQLVDFKPALPLGISLKGIDVYSFGGDDPIKARPRPRPRQEENAMEGEEPVAGKGTPGEPAPAEAMITTPPILTLDRVTVSSLLPLLLPSAGALKYEAELYGGTVDGSYARDGIETAIAFQLSKLDFARYPAKGESYDMQLAGLMGLGADLTLNREKIRDSKGSMTLKLDSLTVKKGSKVKGFDIPIELAFAPAEGNMEIKNGRAELSEMTLESPPLTLKISGSIMLNQVFSRSRFNLKVAMKFGDELKLVASLLPENARSDDGFYHYILSGPFNGLRTRPDRIAARKKGGTTPRAPLAGGETERVLPSVPGQLPIPPRPSMPGGVDTGESAMRPPVLDEADRERLREERRQRAEERRRRREEMRQRRLEGLEDPPVPALYRAEQEAGDGGPRRVPPRFDPPENNTDPEPGDQPDPPEANPWDEPVE